MSTAKEKILVGPCGISCRHCSFYQLKDNSALADFLVSRGFSRDKLKPCPGCRPTEGKCPNANCTRETLFTDLPTGGSSCATYICSVEHGVDFCYECPEFPCVKLQPCADMTNDLPQNMKVFYLSYIKNQGLTEFLEKYPEFGLKYYFGKMVIGKGPQLSDDELKTIKAKLQSRQAPQD